jgi:hypothetical protein
MAQTPDGNTESEQQDSERYVRDLVTRGEAAVADADGNLPPGATHEIVEQEPGRLPKVVRRRYSAF